MNFKQASALVGLIASSTLALSTAPAQAAAFNFTSKTGLGTCAPLAGPFGNNNPNINLSLSTAANCQTADGFKLQAGPSGKVLQGKIDNNVIGVGVSGTSASDPVDAVKAEIDNGEFLKLSLPGAGVLNALGLSFLYQPGVKFDSVFEAARVVTDTGLEGILTVTGNTSATWSFAGGSVVNLSPSTDSGGGYYNILNPFGNNVLSWIQLSPITRTMTAQMGNNGPRPIGPEDIANSDFALTSAKATVAAVPEPTTLVGLGLVGGLLMASRRRKASPVA